MHMKHPSDELYAALVPAFEARGVEGFADQLEDLAAAVESRAPVSEVERAYQAVRARIAEAEASAFPGGPADLNSRLRVILNLVRTAADEYAVGVEDGRVVNAHEYQDALGFVRVARGLLDQVGEQDRARAPEAIARTQQQLDAIAVAWPSLVPPERIDTAASLLYGAAARIEIAALAVK
jgi:hypothetical protein